MFAQVLPEGFWEFSFLHVAVAVICLLWVSPSFSLSHAGLGPALTVPS